MCPWNVEINLKSEPLKKEVRLPILHRWPIVIMTNNKLLLTYTHTQTFNSVSLSTLAILQSFYIKEYSPSESPIAFQTGFRRKRNNWFKATDWSSLTFEFVAITFEQRLFLVTISFYKLYAIVTKLNFSSGDEFFHLQKIVWMNEDFQLPCSIIIQEHCWRVPRHEQWQSAWFWEAANAAIYLQRSFDRLRESKQLYSAHNPSTSLLSRTPFSANNVTIQ